MNIRTDRVPLSKVQDKDETRDVGPENRLTGPNVQSINEMKDMNMLSLMMGYDDNSFNGMGMEIEAIYDWARQITGKAHGSPVLREVKGLIKKLGSNTLKNDLVRKLYVYTQMDSQIQELKNKQRLIRR